MGNEYYRWAKKLLYRACAVIVCTIFKNVYLHLKVLIRTVDHNSLSQTIPDLGLNCQCLIVPSHIRNLQNHVQCVGGGRGGGHFGYKISPWGGRRESLGEFSRFTEIIKKFFHNVIDQT